MSRGSSPSASSSRSRSTTSRTSRTPRSGIPAAWPTSAWTTARSGWARHGTTSRLIVINTELTYELTELREDGLVFTGTNTTATSIDTIDVLRNGRGDGVRVSYDADVTFHDKARYADPLMTLIFLKLAGETGSGITRSLEQL